MHLLRNKPAYVKLLIALMVFTLLLPLNINTTPAFAADSAVVNEDFSTYPLGPLTIGSGNNWTKEGTAPVVEVVNDSTANQNYAAISHDLTGSSYFGQRFAPQTGGMILQFDLNMPTSKGGTFWVMEGKVNATNAAVTRMVMDGGAFKLHNGPTLVTYDTTHWYRFTMIYNIPQKKYALTILDLTTGDTVTSNESFYSARERISSFGFFTNAGGGRYNLANVKVTALDLALQNIRLSAGDFIPSFSFDPTINNYNIELPYSSDNLTVTPTASNADGVSLKVGDSTVESGSSVTVPISGSSSSVAVKVASNAYPDVARTYAINVNKLDKAPIVTDLAAEGRDGKVLIGWKAPIDPAYQGVNIYTVTEDGSETLAAAAPKGTYMAAVDGLNNGTEYTFYVKGVYEYEGEEPSESAPVTIAAKPQLLPARQMEDLGRGLVAIGQDGHVFLSWRLLGTEPDNLGFNVYRDRVKINSAPVMNSTNYIDEEGTADSSYYVRAVVNGAEQGPSETARPWNTNYLNVPLDKPADGVTSAGEAYAYRANDASVGDLDGDGDYEVVLKWDPSNSKDNSQSGITGNTYLDAYQMDGTRLWRIDMGPNIRSGAHYLHPMVYDLDGDGKAEIAARTADGTIDGTGAVIGDASADYRNSGGYVLEGPEYFTIFEGTTGKALATEDYDPPRGNIGDWGDTYGNRIDRFGAAIAYLDGQRPSLILQRGYYTRMVLVAYNWRDGELSKLWKYDSPAKAYGQGNHQLSVADVDNDGKDEVITGNSAINEDGTLLWSTNLGHGDAMHLGDLNPSHLGLELWTMHEETGAPYSATMIDARTGKPLYGQPQVGADTGRGLSADVDPRYEGEESWAIDATKSGATESNLNGFMFNSEGEKISTLIPTSNFAIWWDGDLSRELLDHDWNGATGNGVPKIDKWDYESNQLVRLETFNGTSSNNGTKGNPSLQADLIGDWREEVVVRTEDSSSLRIYSTTDVTDQKLRTLMHDPIYRLGIAWQNTGYNQPPHTGFYLGNGMETPEAPNIYVVDTTAPATTDNAPSGWMNHDVTVQLTANDAVSGVAATYYALDGGAKQKGTSIQVTEDGVHTLVYWSEDHEGNVEAAHTVTIQMDKTAPVLSVTLDKTELWPANHKLVNVNAGVEGTDHTSGIASIVLTSITSNEPLAEGANADIQGADFGTLDLLFNLRAEHSGEGDGRTYTITYTAVDKAGNVTENSVIVAVPHDQSDKKKIAG
ncbi:Cadherin-like beta sandwich domain-containing protein [Paenibacillus catalpae]|uniref:Cadherin-like beta sandwich domain-containing protein n=1 Tax=Paenibacillus catalpae TaxID=1045775 RepID=A0A1I2C203_9BACL|nr:cadherin-like beta sandwich domain-containing protein [Paenibacillus catalpae]SFE62188.1 Cadherin-like beta sandwich domain-containing protein [Paenibacillus catalpae]